MKFDLQKLTSKNVFPVNSIFVFVNKTLNKAYPFENHTLRPDAPIILTNRRVCDVFEGFVTILLRLYEFHTTPFHVLWIKMAQSNCDPYDRTNFANHVKQQ